MKLRSLIAVAAMALCTSVSVGAQERTFWFHERSIERPDSARDVGPLAVDTAFGDRHSLYDGSVEFSHVDVSIPGNSALAVELRRTLPIADRSEGIINGAMNTTGFGRFADWDLDIPHLSGTFLRGVGWQVNTPTPNNRCSTGAAPRSDRLGSLYAPHSFWNGYRLNIPGFGKELLLGASQTEIPRPADGANYRWISKSLAWVSCKPTTRNGYPGEAFLVTTPDGIRYHLDHVIEQHAPRVTAVDGAGTHTAERRNIFFVASKVEDQFGNWVEYTWNGNRLQSITSNDGRSISITYDSVGRIIRATTSGQHWQYIYSDHRLSRVVLPDNTEWNFSHVGDTKVEIIFEYEDDWENDCPSNIDGLRSQFGSYSVRHPSGALGEFFFDYQRHHRSNTPFVCEKPVQYYEYLEIPNYSEAYSLVRKRVTGPGLQSAEWTYQYELGGTDGWRWHCEMGFTVMCPTQKTQRVNLPNGERVEYDYGIMYDESEGQLLATRNYSASNTLLRTATHAYVTADEIPSLPFPARVGNHIVMYGNVFADTALRPEKSRTIEQQGVAFSSLVSSYDQFARPVTTSKSSDVDRGLPRTEQVTYHDNLSRWVLGQPAGRTVNGTSEFQVDYNPQALPSVIRRFGRVSQSVTYNANGTVATVRDGNNRVTTLSNWKRGKPQTVQFPATPESPSGATVSAVVHDRGWITRITDENGYATNYNFDPVGRLQRVIHPTNDTVAWNDTLITFTRAAAAEYGIPAGHWQHTVSTGNGRMVTYLDALWRPLLVREFDTANPTGTQRFVRQNFDHEGRITFASYPSASATPTTGIRTQYDALSRPTSVSRDSELGVLTTTTEYLPGFLTRVNRPRSRTLTSYLAWDEPTTDYPHIIDTAPGTSAAASIDIVRNVFGNPTSLRRRNAQATVALTRSYVYDAHQQLCKSVEPETGATIKAYDNAGNLVWSRSGSTLTSTANCNTANVPVAERTVRSYDARNRIQSLTFPDNRGNTTYAYEPDGALSQITLHNGGAGVVSTAYTYNRRRMPIGEAVGVGSHQWGTGYAYNANGHLQAHSLPGGLTVNYDPNALGQATRAGTYATNVSYFPNGAVRQFTYGNGIVHTLTQNARGLPDRRRDAFGGIAFHDDSLDYDQHGNVAAISDGLAGHRGDRTMTYDPLDRLSTTVSPMFGTAVYTYDALDNLLRLRLTSGSKVRNHTYGYIGNRLTSVTNTVGGGIVATLAYDAQGNLASRNGQAYQFDFGNRLREVPGVESYLYDGHGRRVQAIRNGASIYSVYGQDGVLRYQRDERADKLIEYVHLGGRLVAQLEDAIPLGTPALTAPSGSSTGSYTVSWTSVTNATRYELEERLGTGSWSRIQNTSATSRTISGRHEGAWSYRVRACDGAGCGGWSATATVQVSQAPASAPTLTAPSSNSSGSYSVSWAGVAGATRYELEERLGAGNWSQIQNTSATSRAISGKGTGSWGYRVRACNATGCGGWSSTATVEVLRPPAAAPTLTAPATNTTGSYTVSWTSVATATRYELEERLGAGGWSLIQNTGATNWAISGKTAGAWGYRGRACNTSGCGGWSSIVTVNVLLPPASAPTLTAPASNTSGSYSVSWTGVAAATRYELEERLGAGSWSQIQNTSATNRAISGKATGNWGYRVRACNGSGCAGWSAIRTVEVLRPPAAAPTLTAPATNTTGSYTVSWTSVATATRYELEERLGAGGWSLIQNTGATNRAISGKTAGAWGYRGRACNTSGCGGWSSIVTVNVLLPPASAPTLTAPASNTSGSYSVSWTTVAAAARYELEERLGAGGWSQIQNTSATNRAISGKATGNWGYRVRACNGSGCAGWSAIRTVEVVRPPASAPTITAPGVVPDGNYTVTWTAVSSATRYLLEANQFGTWYEVQNTSARQYSVSSPGHMTLRYRVRACNVDCGPLSSEVTVIVPERPGFPAIQIPPAQNHGSYTIRWTGGIGGSYYELQERVNSGAWQTIYTGTARERAFSGKPVGTYSYSVRACNQYICGWYAGPVTTETVPGPPPAPTLTVSPSSVPEGQPFGLSWTAVTPVTRYELQYRSVNNPWVSLYSGPDRTRAHWLAAGAYVYRVRACNGDLCGPYSAERSGVVSAPLPPPGCTPQPCIEP